MSIDLEWTKLDSSLTSSLVDALNRQLETTSRPSFIGPIEVASFDLGSTAPDIELVDLRDIYRDFLEDDEDEDADADAGASNRNLAQDQEDEDEDGFEWVSRREVRGKGMGEDGPAYHMLPPHMRYGLGSAYGPAHGLDVLPPSPFMRSPRDIWSPAFASLADLRPSYPAPMYVSPISALSPMRTPLNLRPPPPEPSPLRAEREPDSDPEPPAPAPPPAHAHPNLQLHLHITWHASLRLTLTTSLLINYPSPMFMSLPIKLSVTGLLFNGEVVVAYEGERRRVHLCILDELDPYGPLAGDRPKRDSLSASVEGTPPRDAGDEDGTPPLSASSRPGKPLPIGQRLLPTIFIESEIGQADKHVLKNVTRVERFIQDVIRKTVEEELVFPNFHTVVLPDGES